MNDDRNLADLALDIFVYAPVGFALEVKEMIPKLAERGRGQVVNQVSLHEASSLAKEAFEFGAPLLLTSIQADYIAQVTEPTGLRAPVNQFAHGREFVDASDRTVVGFNVDNLYSFAVVDVSDEPMVMSVPEMGDRYWIL